MSNSQMTLYPPTAYDVHNKIKLHFSPAIDAACERIMKACKGLGTDEKALVDVLGALSPNDRELIAHRYKELYKTELKKLMKSETSGDFGHLLQLISVPTPQAECYILFKACKGMGTSESDVWPVIMGRTNEEIAILKRTYFDEYNKDLAVLMANEVSGDFKKVILAALQGPMVEYKASFHTQAKAEEDAEKLYKAGVGKWGTDEETFIKLLLSSPPRHLAVMNMVYSAKHGHSIKAAVEKEFSGDAKKALVHFVRVSLEPVEYLAEHFESTMKGMGTDEKGLSAALVRYHAWLPLVKPAYQKQYKSTLKDRINGETSGDFRALLLAVLDAPTSPPARP